MTETPRPASGALLVGTLPDAESALRDRGIRARSVPDAGVALETLSEAPADCVVTAGDAGSLTGIELAAVVHQRAAVPVVIADPDPPAVAGEAAGVSAVCSPSDPSAVADAVEAATARTPDGALSDATIAALESLYELDSASQSVGEWLESVARIGCERLDLPYGFVTRIEGDTQHIVAAVGDDDRLQAGNSAALSDAYCRHTIENDGVVGFSDVRDVDWVSDAALERFELSCYVGSRIELGELYGTICFADHAVRERRFSAEEGTFVKLLTQWVQYELSSRERRSEIRLKNRAMDEAEVGITISDPDRPDNPVVYANEGFERVTGYPVADVLGRNCRFLQGADTDPDTVRQIREAIDAGEGLVTELRNYRPDGTEFWNQLGIHPLTEDGEVTHFVGFQRDITDRKEREQELLAYETAVNTAADSIYRLDTNGRFRMVSDAVCAMTGYDREALLGAPLETLLSKRDAARTERRIADAKESPGHDIHSLTVTVQRRDGTTFPAETRLAVLPENGDHRGTVLVTRDISDRRAHERTLTELHDVSRALLGAENRAEISRTIASAADEILDIEASGVYRFDEQANRLVPDIVPDSTAELLGELPTFGPGDSIAWDAFVSGERRIYDDVTEDPDVYNPETPIRSELLLPIANYGLLICGSTTTAAYDQQTVELADLLAANAQAAYDRMERDQRLYRRERELRDQNQRLERLDAVNDRVRRICHALVGATTREEIATLICDGLSAVDQYAFVWIGEFDHLDGAVRPVATAGRQRGYLDAVSLAPGDAPEPTVRATTDREPIVDNRIASEFRRGDWQRASLNRDYRAAISLPLRHNGVPYGALSVYADTADSFDEETQEVLSDLAETAAYSMAAVEQRQALLSDQRVELVFELAAQPTTVFTLAAELGGTVTVDQMIPRSNGGSILYGSATGIDGTTFERYCAESSGIESATVTSSGREALRFELHVTGPFIGTTVADHGGAFDELRITDGRGQLVAVFPTAVSLSDFNRRFTEQYDGVELLARREHRADRDDSTGTEALTGRQREALAVACQRGFYEWPREHTAEEIAASLDITAPTFLEHLRRAESKVVANALESTADPDEGRSD